MNPGYNFETFTNPKAPTIVETYDATISASTAITLNAATTYIEVSAIAAGIFLKWNGTAATSDFDEYISPDETRLYIRPAGATTANFIQASANGILVVLEK